MSLVNTLGSIYKESVSEKGSVILRDNVVAINEEVDIRFKYSNGISKHYKLDDEYARIVNNQVAAESNPDIENHIDNIFVQGGWTGDQEAVKKQFKSIFIESTYSLGIELIEYLSTNKNSLLTLEKVGIGKTINFIDAIKSSLPNKFIVPGIDDLIKQVHYQIKPKASTNVGMGEGTFSIFGTAQKGRSGDLLWSDKEVEVKTNGDSNTGAVLGGDGTLNKSFTALQEFSQVQYIDRAIASGNRVLEVMNSLKSEFEENQKIIDINKFKKVVKDNEAVLPKSAVDNIQSIKSGEDLFITPTTKSYTAKKVGLSAGGPSFYDRLSNMLQVKSDILHKRGQNLPSQLSSFFDVVEDRDLLIRGFAALKSYSSIKTDIHGQLIDFFNQNDINQFLPKVDYSKFSRLVGAISLICYQEIIGFDILMTGNDKTFQCVNIEFENPTVSSIYDQLLHMNVQFDLNIDAFVNGVPRSQTVFAKSPRIKLL